MSLSQQASALLEKEVQQFSLAKGLPNIKLGT